jgi:hypothetical protein
MFYFEKYPARLQLILYSVLDIINCCAYRILVLTSPLESVHSESEFSRFIKDGWSC